VLAIISTNTVEKQPSSSLNTSKSLICDNAAIDDVDIPIWQNPMVEDSASFALGILDPSQQKLLSRDRSVFASLVDLHSKHQKLLLDISKVIELMCT
jgi:hypothetical protein